MRVTDDGVGLPADFNIEKTNSLGLELVASLVSQHRGKLEIKSNGRTEFDITMKKVPSTTKIKV